MAMSEGSTVVEANSRMGVTEQYKKTHNSIRAL